MSSASEKLNLVLVFCGKSVWALISAESKVHPDLPILGAVIAHSEIVVTLPDTTAQRFPANFDAVDIVILV